VRLSLVAVAGLGLRARDQDDRGGDPCEKGKAACLDPQTELECQAGRLVAAPCRGPKGCAVSQGVQTCDFSANVAGDSCATIDEEVAECAPSKKARVVCRASKYVVEPCKGPRGCFDEGGDRVGCDATLAEEGDPCSGGTDGAPYLTCSVDRTKSLRCDGGKLVVDELCRGTGGCDASQGAELVCDHGAQSAGDPCGADGGYECSGDKNTLLVCKERRWTVARTCKASCVSTDKTADCGD
jgi:hypothetical protein